MLITIIANNIIAQPILTESAFLPIGSSMLADRFNNIINIGGSGPNQNWNFNNYALSSVGAYYMVTPSTLSCAASFPLANYAIQFSQAAATSYFFTRSTTSQELVGINGSFCQSNTVYSDYLLEYKFPFSYLDSISDSYVSNSSNGTITMVYDAYGTFTTPTGLVYSNTGRIKITKNNQEDYLWFHGDSSQFPIARTFNNLAYTVFYYNFVTNLETPDISKQIIIYPNPCSNFFTLEHTIPGSNLIINDVIGKEIFKTKIGSELTTTINTNDFKNGIYTIFIESNGITTQKKLVVNN